MISRKEFYFCWIINIALIIGNIFFSDSALTEIKRDKSDVLDSLLHTQRDSALNRALIFELKVDSLQAIVNRKNLDIQIIKKKTQDEKKNVLILNADSTLSYFLRTTGGN